MSAPRLVDRVLAWDGLPDSLRETLSARPPAFLATNVARYYSEGTDKEVWVEGTDFPNVAPPFPAFWMEWDAPTRYLSEVNGEVLAPEMAGVRIGALVQALELGTNEERAERRSVSTGKDEQFLAVDFELPAVNPGMKRANAPLDSRWFCVAYLFTGLPDAEPTLDAALFWFAAEDGSYRGEYIKPGVQGGVSGVLHPDVFAAISGGGLLVDGVVQPASGSVLAREYLKMLRIQFHPGLLTISFLHCRNVERRMLPAGPPSRKRNRHRPPKAGLRFHVLEVEPLKVILRREAGEKTGLQQALHICRGHFKTYGAPLLDEKGNPIRDEAGNARESAGLFGRLKGTFWWGDHARGTRSRGEIVKDYSVDGPAEESSP